MRKKCLNAHSKKDPSIRHWFVSACQKSFVDSVRSVNMSSDTPIRLLVTACQLSRVDSVKLVNMSIT